ncbi:MAG TPA: DUF2130 domain-containing protein [Planctomycetota bacterium]|nr:DUF2130 domain-containing protein [Planctomycetota bacterium]
MPEPDIKCPQCGAVIPLNEAVTHRVREQLAQEFAAKLKEQTAAIADREKLAAQREEAARAREAAVDQRVKEQLARESVRIQKEESTRARDAVALDMAALKERAERQKIDLDLAKKNELALLRQKEELETARKDLELEVARRIHAERLKIEQAALQRILDENRLKDAEKDKQVSDLKIQLDEMQRKLAQGSQQLQGEVAELDLEQLLAQLFPTDKIAPVPKGYKGADALQQVINGTGHKAGTIIWESKRVQNFNAEWIAKLKDDQRMAGADIAVLLTTVLPKEIAQFGFREGVWITNHASLPGLTAALRMQLEKVALAQRAATGQHEKMENLWTYLTSPQFIHRVEAIMDALNSLKTDLDAEKRALERSWAKREKQIVRLVSNTGLMYGEMQGLSGDSLPNVKGLDFHPDNGENPV